MPPYHGYAEITSYFDHDDPDYSIDGKMILANGLHVTGAPSPGVFPAYWSPSLRQWINYDGHNGYDYDISYQPVYAAAAGEVVYADWESPDPYFGFGQMILIHHIDGYETLYGHLSRIIVHPGEQVRQGQEIAISGTTGHSTGPHLHFSVYHNCHVMDPYGWSGSGADPLVSYNGETSTYIWKDGDAPLVLNPLPNWPTFDSTLAEHTSGSRSPLPVRVHIPGLPSLPFPSGLPTPKKPLTHLLLLRFPNTASAGAATVLAVFKNQLQNEQSDLVPILTSLREQSLISSFRVLPDLGAIAVTGTLSPEYLLGLPGVAAITGARSKDSWKAMLALEGAMAADVQMPAAPSVFPATYLDAESLWRLDLAVDDNGSYVFGFTQPGAPVHAVLTRQSVPIAWGTSTGDPRRGAFATVMLDARGDDARITPGDVLHVASDGRETQIRIKQISLIASARSGQIATVSPQNTRLSVTANESMTERSVVATVGSSSSTRSIATIHTIDVPGVLTAGDVITARLALTSGNSLFAWSRVPGVELSSSSPVVTGWAANARPWHVLVFSHHKRLAAAFGRPDGAGLLRMYLQGLGGRQYAPTAGDHIEVMSGNLGSWLAFPRWRGGKGKEGRWFNGRVSPSSRVMAQVTKDAYQTSSLRLRHLSRHGVYHVSLGAGIHSGAALSVVSRSSSGNEVRMDWANRGITIHPRSGIVSGTSTPGKTVVIHVFGKHGHLSAAGVALAADKSGGFLTRVVRSNHAPITLRAGDTVTVSDGQTVSRYRVGKLLIRLHSATDIEGWTSLSRHVTATFYEGNGHVRSRTILVDHSHFNLKLTKPFIAGEGAQIEVLAGSPSEGAIEVQVTPLASIRHLPEMGSGRAVIAE